MSEAEDRVVAVNGVRRRAGAQVEQEQSGMPKEYPWALKKEFRCCKCARQPRLTLQRGRGGLEEARGGD